ncbi:hypothetical protein, partial [Massilia glaciei]|uniref:hypothetical protein n=1 Tax=Massilia glaciei TaxID=1524097 RepID=UPI001C637ED3
MTHDAEICGPTYFLRSQSLAWGRSDFDGSVENGSLRTTLIDLDDATLWRTYTMLTAYFGERDR